jgi:hypothetical protein
MLPQQHKSLPKYTMTAAIPALIDDERLYISRAEPIHRPTADGQPPTEPADHCQLVRNGPRCVSHRQQSVPETIHIRLEFAIPSRSARHDRASIPEHPAPTTEASAHQRDYADRRIPEATLTNLTRSLVGIVPGSA